MALTEANLSELLVNLKLREQACIRFVRPGSMLPTLDVIPMLVNEIRFLRSELMDRGVTEKELDNHE